MKKILVVLIVFIGSFTAKAQQEVSIDLGDAIIMKTLEISYEYYLGEQSAVGMSALFNFNGETADLNYNENTMFTPFYRHYFLANGSINYFGEVFLGVNSGKEEGDDDDVNAIDVKYTDAALGLSVGAKYVTDGGLMLSALAGLGRNMFTGDSPELVPRIGVNIGYRF